MTALICCATPTLIILYEKNVNINPYAKFSILILGNFMPVLKYRFLPPGSLFGKQLLNRSKSDISQNSVSCGILLRSIHKQKTAAR